MITREDWDEFVELTNKEIDLSGLEDPISRFITSLNSSHNTYKDYVDSITTAKRNSESATIAILSLVRPEKSKLIAEVSMIDKKGNIEEDRDGFKKFEQYLGNWNKYLDELEDEIHKNIGGIYEGLEGKATRKGTASHKLKKLKELLILVVIDFIFNSIKRGYKEYTIRKKMYKKTKYTLSDFILQELINSMSVLGMETRFELPRLKPIIHQTGSDMIRRREIQNSGDSQMQVDSEMDIHQMFTEPGGESGF